MFFFFVATILDFAFVKIYADFFALSGGNFGGDFAAVGVFKFVKSYSQIIQCSGKEKFNELAFVNVVADFKNCLVALPFNN